MKKLLYVFIALFTMHFGFAQTSEDAKTYVKNMGIKEQLDETKKEILPGILEKNVTDFTKEFDGVVTDFISSLENLTNEAFSTEALKKFNKSVAESETPELMAPKDPVAFEQNVNTLEENLGLSLQGIVIKYADPAFLEELDQE
ncbi:MAG TPA: hypothetical protein VLY87_04945 [Flavobacterium sp.]|nr:hypothetical protein [Flavobacterium sp.]